MIGRFGEIDHVERCSSWDCYYSVLLWAADTVVTHMTKLKSVPAVFEQLLVSFNICMRKKSKKTMARGK